MLVYLPHTHILFLYCILRTKGPVIYMYYYGMLDCMHANCGACHIHAQAKTKQCRLLIFTNYIAIYTMISIMVYKLTVARITNSYQGNSYIQQNNYQLMKVLKNLYKNFKYLNNSVQQCLCVFVLVCMCVFIDIRICLLQDTVIALQALADIASQMYNNDVSMTIKVDHGSGYAKNVTLNAENMDVLQFIDVCISINNVIQRFIHQTYIMAKSKIYTLSRPKHKI